MASSPRSWTFTEALSVYELAPDMMASDVLLVAYAKELEAEQFYAHWADVIEDPDAHRVLLGLSQDEVGHQKALARIYEEMTSGDDIGGYLIGVPPVEEHVFDPAAGPREVLESAAQAEREAVAFYGQVATSPMYTFMAVEFEKLARIEEGHLGRILRLLKEME